LLQLKQEKGRESGLFLFSSREKNRHPGEGHVCRSRSGPKIRLLAGTGR
jgi:hypothetical protein